MVGWVIHRLTYITGRARPVPPNGDLTYHAGDSGAYSSTMGVQWISYAGKKPAINLMMGQGYTWVYSYNQ